MLEVVLLSFHQKPSILKMTQFQAKSCKAIKAKVTHSACQMYKLPCETHTHEKGLRKVINYKSVSCFFMERITEVCM